MKSSGPSRPTSPSPSWASSPLVSLWPSEPSCIGSAGRHASSPPRRFGSRRSEELHASSSYGSHPRGRSLMVFGAFRVLSACSEWALHSRVRLAEAGVFERNTKVTRIDSSGTRPVLVSLSGGRSSGYRNPATDGRNRPSVRETARTVPRRSHSGSACASRGGLRRTPFRRRSRPSR